MLVTPQNDAAADANDDADVSTDSSRDTQTVPAV